MTRNAAKVEPKFCRIEWTFRRTWRRVDGRKERPGFYFDFTRTRVLDVDEEVLEATCHRKPRVS
jgi:hypothetical protein